MQPELSLDPVLQRNKDGSVSVVPAETIVGVAVAAGAVGLACIGGYALGCAYFACGGFGYLYATCQER